MTEKINDLSKKIGLGLERCKEIVLTFENEVNELHRNATTCYQEKSAKLFHDWISIRKTYNDEYFNLQKTIMNASTLISMNYADNFEDYVIRKINVSI